MSLANEMKRRIEQYLTDNYVDESFSYSKLEAQSEIFEHEMMKEESTH